MNWKKFVFLISSCKCDPPTGSTNLAERYNLPKGSTFIRMDNESKDVYFKLGNRYYMERNKYPMIEIDQDVADPNPVNLKVNQPEGK